MNDKFSDGSASAYAELPVKAAYLRWTRGNANLRALRETDPAQYFGGWRALVTARDGTLNPELPLPVVERASQDGKHLYKAYATNVLEFLPIQHRTRFELREKVTDQTGNQKDVIRAIAKARQQGYAPHRQVFGLVYVGHDSAPAILDINAWSAFISFERTGQIWGRMRPPEGSALIRRYGSTGAKDKASGLLMPNFERYGEGYSTPIEAIDREHPRYILITPELDALSEQSQAWRNCERWNAEGKVDEPVEPVSALDRFMARANELSLSEADIEQLLAENGNDYSKALKALEGFAEIEMPF